jgi:hypothetical protein
MGDLRHALKDPKQRRKILIAVGGAGALVLLLVLHNRNKTETEPEGEVTPTTRTRPLAESEGEGGGELGGGGGGGVSAGGLETALATQALGQQQGLDELGEQINGLAAQLSSQFEGSHPNAGVQEPAASSGPSGTPLANAHSLVNNQAGNPRQGKPYKLEAAPGGVYHNYGGKIGRVFVASHPSPSQGPKVIAQHAQPVTPGQGRQTNQTGNARQGEEFTTGKYKGKKAHIYRRAVKGGVGPNHNIIVL